MGRFERFVIQRKGRRRDEYTDWVNPMNGQLDYQTHAEAVRALLKRANAIDYRIVRRTYTWHDEQVGINL